MLGHRTGDGAKINRLNARGGDDQCYGRHADGGGLYLSVSPMAGGVGVSVSMAWQTHGDRLRLGARSYRSHARRVASEARAKLAEGINPKDARRPSSATFGECADRVIDAMRPSWRNSKHAAQWEMTLRDYAAPWARKRTGNIIAKAQKTALELAGIIRNHIRQPELKIGVYYDEARGWRANVYDSATLSEKQSRVDEIVQEMRDFYQLVE